MQVDTLIKRLFGVRRLAPIRACRRIALSELALAGKPRMDRKQASAPWSGSKLPHAKLRRPAA